MAKGPIIPYRMCGKIMPWIIIAIVLKDPHALNSTEKAQGCFNNYILWINLLLHESLEPIIVVKKFNIKLGILCTWHLDKISINLLITCT